ncbi:MAG: hypothetical protein V4714_05640 [Bacteroidota bacterium]
MLTRVATALVFLGSCASLLTDGQQAVQLLQQWGIFYYKDGQATLPFLLAYHQAFIIYTSVAILISVASVAWWFYCQHSNREEPFFVHSLNATLASILLLTLCQLTSLKPITTFLLMLTIATGVLYFLYHLLIIYYKYYIYQPHAKIRRI